MPELMAGKVSFNPAMLRKARKSISSQADQGSEVRWLWQSYTQSEKRHKDTSLATEHEVSVNGNVAIRD